MVDQTDFYEHIIDYIAFTTDTSVITNITGDRWTFRDPATGRISLNIDIWQWFDENRSILGEPLLYSLIMGI
jgi:hypothetical protein